MRTEERDGEVTVPAGQRFGRGLPDDQDDALRAATEARHAAWLGARRLRVHREELGLADDVARTDLPEQGRRRVRILVGPRVALDRGSDRRRAHLVRRLADARARPTASHGNELVPFFAACSPSHRIGAGFIVETGLRVGEAVRMRWSWIRWAVGRPMLEVPPEQDGWRPKGRRGRSIPLSEEARPVRIYTGVHGLRRTAGARWLARGVAAHVVQRWLGHADLRTTMAHYGGLADATSAEAMARVDAHARLLRRGRHDGLLDATSKGGGGGPENVPTRVPTPKKKGATVTRNPLIPGANTRN